MPLMHRPAGIGAFEFVILSSLRAQQLIRGCTPRIEGLHKKTVTAQLEVSQGKVGFATADAAVRTVASDAVPADEIVPVLAT
jgi:DNA-directed RNA polymerase subunit K/omega